MSRVTQLEWIVAGELHVVPVSPEPCAFCGAVAITLLPPPIRKEQPDDTTHVCHPSLGGCNQGWAPK